MTDLPDHQRIILERYLARRQVWDQEGKGDSGKETGDDTNAASSERPAGDPNIEALINHGAPFYNTDKQGDIFIGVAHSLREAQTYVKSGGIVASLPFLIAGKTRATKTVGGKVVRNPDHYVWKNWLTALSEENVGIDTKGKYVQRNKPIVITVHGGGILSTPERILQAYQEALTPQNAAKYVDKNGRPTGEFEGLLDGRLPNGEAINLYSIEDVVQGRIANPFARHAIWTPYETAKNTPSGHIIKTDFLKNELVLSRSSTILYLPTYFDLAQNDGKVGNWHRLKEIDPNIPQGRVLFLNANNGGLDGDDNLGGGGRFVGVRTGGSP